MGSKGTSLLVSRSDDPASILAVSSFLPGHVEVAGAIGGIPPLTGREYARVYLHRVATDAPLPARVLSDLFAHSVQSVEHIDELGTVRPHRPFHGLADQPRVLNVLAGSALPLNSGARRRAFELTLHLNRRGIPTELLLGALGAARRSRLSSTLQAISPAIHTYRRVRPPLPFRLRLRREAERMYRLGHGVLRPAPDLFVDRLATRASADGVNRLKELIGSGRYGAVIVNYAWMSGMIEEVREATPEVIWICDTHDVQFVRGSTLDEGGPRLWVDSEAQRDAELAALRGYDAVLAISETDQRVFQRFLPGVRIVAAPPGCEYARLEIPSDPSVPPFRFGFIGGNMSANAIALEYLLREWWPQILRVSPGSRLTVAGSVCRRGRARKAMSGQHGVTPVGFIPSLGSFYEGVDVVLNPVLVQGGLNFKSMEALAAGRLLITNPLGALCLGEGAPVVVADEGTSLSDHLEGFLTDPLAMHRIRSEGQRWGMDRFGEQRAYGELRGLLEGM